MFANFKSHCIYSYIINIQLIAFCNRPISEVRSSPYYLLIWQKRDKVFVKRIAFIHFIKAIQMSCGRQQYHC